MNSLRASLIVALFTLSALKGVGAQTPPVLRPATVETLERTITGFMAQNDVPGLSAAVVTDGALSWSDGYGMSDLENFVPAKATTVYRLASVSKTLTATAVMKLYEQGKVELDAPVQKYCPAFPPKPSPITTRQLLQHRAGIRHYQGDEISSTRNYLTMTESLQIFAGDPLLSEPGAKFNYTTYGYTVLGCVLEGVSGQKYIDFIRQNILLPAGMDHTDVDDLRKIIHNRAQGYQKSKSGDLMNSDLADTSYKIPGGGLVSTVEDLARFAIALENDTLLKRATRELMWRLPQDAEAVENPYALGWRVSNQLGFRTAGHSGNQQRVSTVIILAPEEKTAVVVLANLEGAPVADLARDVLSMIHSKSAPESPAKPH